ncbi:hypothetical protein UK23_06295 [Lentzea aerocolonigenes]|uniref:Condensation domain-containing protein n=1 Tax=Lentzea aerocolonigenes TaxID=68170 RepID=A0A0F0HD72_LENAE|nr:condensation domain-containing protein [Lentzea aerocolonigenes]KJK51583.1 hypothetical protein UK23_06295 [Lentzea aerocolonigenes]
MSAPVIRELVLPVTGERAGRAPLSWAQRVQWNDTQAIAPDDHHFNLARVVEVPPGWTTPELAGLLAALTGRHECLRTRYLVDADGNPYQEVFEQDELRIAVHEAVDVDALRGKSFDLTGLPVRMSVVESGGVPRQLVLVLSHVTIDFAGANLLVDELRSLLAGEVSLDGLPPVAHRQFDEAARQATPAGQRRSAASLRYWEKLLRESPLTIFGPPVAGDADRFGQLSMSSPALTAATTTVARRMGVSGTTVVMAAVNVMLGRITGQTAVPLRLIASNRGLTELRDVVGITLGSCAILVPTRGRSFAEAVWDTAEATMQAYRRAQCDPVALTALRAAVSAERGVDEIEMSCGFNDIRVASASVVDGYQDAVGLLSRTGFSWQTPLPEQESKLWYWVREQDGVDVHHALVDTWYLPRERAETLVRGVEHLVVTAAASCQ